MTQFAAVFSQAGQEWSGIVVDLNSAGSIEDLSGIVHEVAGDAAILCVESEDEWFAILRFEADEDVRVFLSDVQAALIDDLALLLAEAVGASPQEGDLGVHPVGDIELLEDLGLADAELVELSLEEGVLPADTLSVIAERLGFAGELEQLR